jgi:hypothetical protein
MRRVSDDRLVQIPDLDGDASVDPCDRTQIADVTIPADPDGGPFGQRPAFLLLEPFIEFDGTAANISMRGASHFEGLSKTQNRNAVVGPD